MTLQKWCPINHISVLRSIWSSCCYVIVHLDLIPSKFRFHIFTNPISAQIPLLLFIYSRKHTHRRCHVQTNNRKHKCRKARPSLILLLVLSYSRFTGSVLLVDSEIHRKNIFFPYDIPTIVKSEIAYIREKATRIYDTVVRCVFFLLSLSLLA